MIPNYQNRVRKGYRTNNNPFILRCVKEWDRTDGLTIYVDTANTTKAFPSTDHPTNVVELLCMGMEVALFDWLRMLDQKMEYDI